MKNGSILRRFFHSPASFSGFSLVEVVAATFIFMLAAIPIYYTMSHGAVKEIDSTKLAMARKVLESFRAETIGWGFPKLAALTPPDGNTSPDGGFGPIPDGNPPKTYSDVLTIQKKYKDFTFKPLFRYSVGGKSVIEVKGRITWTRQDGKLHPDENLLFFVVKP